MGGRSGSRNPQDLLDELPQQSSDAQGVHDDDDDDNDDELLAVGSDAAFLAGPSSSNKNDYNLKRDHRDVLQSTAVHYERMESPTSSRATSESDEKCMEEGTADVLLPSSRKRRKLDDNPSSENTAVEVPEPSSTQHHSGALKVKIMMDGGSPLSSPPESSTNDETMQLDDDEVVPLADQFPLCEEDEVNTKSRTQQGITGNSSPAAIVPQQEQQQQQQRYLHQQQQQQQQQSQRMLAAQGPAPLQRPPRHHEVKLQLFVRMPNQPTLAVQVAPDTTASSLMETIRERTGLPAADHYLLLGNRMLSPEQPLSACHVAHNDTLHLVGRLRSTLFPDIWRLVWKMEEALHELQRDERELLESAKSAGVGTLTHGTLSVAAGEPGRASKRQEGSADGLRQEQAAAAGAAAGGGGWQQAGALPPKDSDMVVARPASEAAASDTVAETAGEGGGGGLTAAGTAAAAASSEAGRRHVRLVVSGTAGASLQAGHDEGFIRAVESSGQVVASETAASSSSSAAAAGTAAVEVAEAEAAAAASAAASSGSGRIRLLPRSAGGTVWTSPAGMPEAISRFLSASASQAANRELPLHMRGLLLAQTAGDRPEAFVSHPPLPPLSLPPPPPPAAGAAVGAVRSSLPHQFGEDPNLRTRHGDAEARSQAWAGGGKYESAHGSRANLVESAARSHGEGGMHVISRGYVRSRRAREQLKEAVMSFLEAAGDTLRSGREGWSMKLLEQVEAFRLAGGVQLLAQLLLLRGEEHVQFAKETVCCFIKPTALFDFCSRDLPWLSSHSPSLLPYFIPLVLELRSILEASSICPAVSAAALDAIVDFFEKSFFAGSPNPQLNRSPDWVVRNLMPLFEKAASLLSLSLHQTSLLASGRTNHLSHPLSHASTRPFSVLGAAISKAVPYCRPQTMHAALFVQPGDSVCTSGGCGRVIGSSSSSRGSAFSRSILSVLQSLDECLEESSKFAHRLLLLTEGSSIVPSFPAAPFLAASAAATSAPPTATSAGPRGRAGDASSFPSEELSAAATSAGATSAGDATSAALSPEAIGRMALRLLPGPVQEAVPMLLAAFHEVSRVTAEEGEQGGGGGGRGQRGVREGGAGAVAGGGGVSGQLLRLIERHKGAVNETIKTRHLEMRGSLHWMLQHRDLLSFDVKKAWLLDQLPRPAADYEERVVLMVHRGPSILPESFEQIAAVGSHALRSGLVVQFHDEEGSGVGVLREWFMLLGAELFNGDNALFSSCPSDKQRFFPSSLSDINPGHLSYFRFCGRVVALALMHNVHLDVTFALPFFNLLAGRKVSWHDCADVDPELHASCRSIIGLPDASVDDDVLGLTFVCAVEGLGESSIVELRPGGENIKVTSRNRREFVDLLINAKVAAGMRQQAQAFADGFCDLTTTFSSLPQLLTPFDAADFERLLYGEERDICVADWRRHTTYHGYTKDSPEVHHFWKALESMTPSERRRFLYFSTAITRLPPSGFAGLPSRFHLHRGLTSTGHLPSAHTCFFQLVLPPYRSLQTMQKRLRAVLGDHMVQGFGFA